MRIAQSLFFVFAICSIMATSVARAQAKPDSVLTELPEGVEYEVVPYLDPKTKRTQGFKLVNIAAGSKLEKMGLKTDDVIVEIDGEKMTSIAHAQTVYSSLRSVEPVTLGILRGGKKIEKVSRGK